MVLRIRKKILDKDPMNSLEDTDTDFCFILARVSYACSAKLSEGTWLRCAIAHLDWEEYNSVCGQRPIDKVVSNGNHGVELPELWPTSNIFRYIFIS